MTIARAIRRPAGQQARSAWNPDGLRQRHGFTLIEMLVVAGIMLILLTITVVAYSAMSSTDRIRSSARQVQSAFSGARDRAIKAAKDNPQERRGLRLLVDATDPSTVTSFIYVGNDGPWTEGRVIVGRADNPNGAPDGVADSQQITTVRGYGTSWLNLYAQGLLVDGARIKIPAGASGTWYTVNTGLLAGAVTNRPEVLILTSPFLGSGVVPYGTSPTNGFDGQPGVGMYDDDSDGTADNPGEIGWLNSDDITDANPFGQSGFDYILELKPNVLPGQEPLKLSSGIAIDLDNSKIPSSWYQQKSVSTGSPAPPPDLDGVWTLTFSAAGNDVYRKYLPRMDVMFSPQGTVNGPVTASGLIHLRLADIEDITQGRNPANPQAGTMLYSTVYPQTGYVATYPVNVTDTTPNDGIADDPLYFVRIGGTAGK